MKLNFKKFIVIPIIILCMFAIADLPKSHAKYIKTGDFAYDVKLKGLELSDDKNLSVTLDNSSTYLDAIYNVSSRETELCMKIQTVKNQIQKIHIKSH